MRRTLFLSRVAFICNLFFLLALFIQLTNWVTNAGFVSFIFTTGYLLALIFSPVVFVCYLVLMLQRKKLLSFIPAWLVAANVLFFIFQIIFILFT